MRKELITQNARHCALDCENPIIANNRQDQCGPCTSCISNLVGKKENYAMTIKLIHAVIAETWNQRKM